MATSHRCVSAPPASVDATTYREAFFAGAPIKCSDEASIGMIFIGGEWFVWWSKNSQDRYRKAPIFVHFRMDSGNPPATAATSRYTDAVGIAAGYRTGDETSIGTVFGSGSWFFFTKKND
jgi:hypothetical protein